MKIPSCHFVFLSWVPPRFILQTFLMGALLPALFGMQQASGQSWQPASDELVLEYKVKPGSVPKTTGEKIASLENLLNDSKQIGQSYKIAQAQTIFNSLDHQKLSNPQEFRLLYLKAQLLQKNHQFAEALKLLNQIPTTANDYPAAQLLASRLAILHGDSKAAVSYCTRVIQTLGPDIAHLCVLETKLDDPNSQIAYKKLAKRLTNAVSAENNLSAASSNTPMKGEQQLIYWLNRLGANLALIANEKENAIQLMERNLATDELYDLLLWTDLRLEQFIEQTAPQNSASPDKSKAQNNEILQSLYQRLDTLARTHHHTIEDALVLRLARIEKLLQQDSNDQTPQYQVLAQQRMQLRLARRDLDHTADLAYYFLHLQQQPRAAVYWATKNLESSKDFVDQRLYQQARLTTGS